MGSESTLRKKVVKLLRTLNAEAVENRCGVGMPDVCVITLGVWIECKKTAAFPKRPDSKVALTHELLPSQRVWLNRCARRGGTAYTLTQVANEFFLHDGPTACEVLGEVDRATLTSTTVLHCVGWASLERELIPYLTSK